MTDGVQLHGVSLRMYFIALVVSGLLEMAAVGAVTNLFDLGAAEAGYGVPRHIRYSFTITNTKGVQQDRAVFLSYAPIQKTARQCCVRLEVSPSAELLTDRLGNAILRFDLAPMPPFGVIVVTVKAELMLATRPMSAPDEMPARFFLDPEPGIESDHPEIVKLAKTLKAREPIQTARQIADWVAVSVEDAGYVQNARGALHAFQSRQGDCTEYASLFVALCRADGVPARVVGGYRCSANAILNGAGYHNWAEFFDGGVWRQVDPFLGFFDGQDASYISMSFVNTDAAVDAMRGASRYRVDGDGLRAAMNR